MKRSISKSFAWSFLEQGGSKAIALLVQIVLARLLAPEAFGLLAIMLVVVDIATTVSQSGLGTALVQKPDIDDLDCTTAFWLSIGLATAFYAVIFFGAPFLAAFYGMSGLSPCLRVIALAIPINAVNSVQRSLLQRDLDFKAIFKTNISAVVISGAAGIGVAILGLGVWALVIQTLFQAMVSCVVMAGQVPWRPSIAFDRGSLRSLFSYGWKICATGILNVIYTGISELIIGKACDAGQLGYYSQGRKWPLAGMHVVSNALQNVMFPAFSSMQGDPERLRSAIRKALRVGNFVMAPFALFFCVAAEPVVALLLGEAWLPCVLVFQLACATNCVLMLQLVNLRAYMALGDSGLYLKLQVIKVCVGGAIIWTTAVLTKDIYWTALATSAWGFCSILIVDLSPARRKHGVGRVEQLRIFAPTFAAALGAAVAAWALTLLEWPYGLLLVAQVVVFGGVYWALCRVFKVRGRRECFDAVRELVSLKR